MRHFLAKYHESLHGALDQMQVTLGKGESIDGDKSLALLCDWTRAVQSSANTIHVVGNGASACMASHMALDWNKNAHVKAAAYNDLASLTAIGNDMGYDKVFSQPILWYGRENDMLATVSSSGNSPSIVEAIAAAREKKMKVVTFSGMKPNNASRKLGDLNFYVAAWSYGIVECAHQVLLHAWLDGFMNVKEWDLKSPQIITLPPH